MSIFPIVQKTFDKIIQIYTPLRHWPTAHIIGVTTISCNYCFHNLWLKVNCISNFLLTEIFKRGLDVVDESTVRFSRWFPSIKSVIQPTKKILPGIECNSQGDFRNGSTALNKRRSMTRLLAIYRKNGEKFESNSFCIF